MSETRSAQTWRLAARQHGVLARRQLLALGFSAAAVQHRIAYGRLHPVVRGIYAVGWPHLDPRRRWAAAVLTAAAGDRGAPSPTQPYLGDAAALSHRSAAALWGVGEEHRGQIDLTVRRREARPRHGLRIHGRPALAPEAIVTFEDLPVTSPVQTLIDIATELGPIAIERAVNDADKRDLIDPEALRLALNDHAGEPGVCPAARSSTASPSASPTRTWRSTSARSPPPPASPPRSANSGSTGSKSTFFWPNLGLVVETSGFSRITYLLRRSMARRRLTQGGRGRAAQGRREPE